MYFQHEEKDIKHYVEKFVKDRRHAQDGRYTSFDYCFNYFQDFRANGKTNLIANTGYLQQSCLQLGFYLASWGMYRGSSFLLQQSCHFLEKPLKIIAEYDKNIWEIDVDTYNESNKKLILDCAKEIKKSMEGNILERDTTDTLVTKIMLGVFGNIPAYDTYLKKGLGISSLNDASLREIFRVYKDFSGCIDSLAQEIKTTDFLTGEKTMREYTKAKILDMYGFERGFQILESPKKY